MKKVVCTAASVAIAVVEDNIRLMDKAIYIHLPANKRLVWYLAAEEYFAKHIHALWQGFGKDSGEVLFTWIVPPTVIFGRHQVMANEVNIPYCQSHNIAMYRRKSGGGCVFADQGNLMVSYISTSPHSEQVFQTYLDKMSDCLRTMGYDAVKSTHNDIMVGEHKVSGNACFAQPQATIVHGTLLYDVNFDILQQAITPSQEKLAKHGVQSVRQRVINLKNIANGVNLISIHELAQKIEEFWCDERFIPTENDLLEICKIEQEYLNPAFIQSR